jgi:tRNA pseudouridine55 synthase
MPRASSSGAARAEGYTGFVVVDKEPGWTSHDVVARCRRIFGQRRVGHAGTLDPDATGVLLVGLGRATRLLRFASALGKTYSGEVVLGVATSTLDAAGTVVSRHDMGSVTLEDVQAAATALTGRINQVPPMVSAVKVGGRRLYDLEREGVEVERVARPVTVTRFDVAETEEPGVYRIEVACSSGTYVRVLAADLGEALGGGAHLRALRRLSVGSFSLDESHPLAELDPSLVRPPAELLRDYPAVTLDGELELAVRHGKVLDRSELGIAGDGPWVLLGEAGLLAVYEAKGVERAKPAVVMLPAESPSPGAEGTTPAQGPDPGEARVTSVGVENGQGVARSVVTIGAYDGVHAGHRMLIGEVLRVASERGLHSVGVTFDRHPATVVRPQSAPRLITDLQQKLDLLRGAGLDEVVVVPFDAERASESAEDFVSEILVGRLAAAVVIVGEDFHFGRGRRGNVALLEAMGKELGFVVVGFGLMTTGLEGDAVSSTRIRSLIESGDVAAARALLGRAHEVRGEVVTVLPAGAEGSGTVVVRVPGDISAPAAGRYGAVVSILPAAAAAPGPPAAPRAPAAPGAPAAPAAPGAPAAPADAGAPPGAVTVVTVGPPDTAGVSPGTEVSFTVTSGSPAESGPRTGDAVRISFENRLEDSDQGPGGAAPDALVSGGRPGSVA